MITMTHKKKYEKCNYDKDFPSFQMVWLINHKASVEWGGKLMRYKIESIGIVPTMQLPVNSLTSQVHL